MANRLSNTDYFIDSGTWQVQEDADTGERYIINLAPGRIYRRNLVAEGTWDFSIVKDRPAGDFNIGFIASILGTIDDAAQVGYWLQVAASERVIFVESRGGAHDNHFFTRTDYDVLALRYDFRITRDATNWFTVYVKDGHLGPDWQIMSTADGGGGTNPIQDATTTTSLYTVIEMEQLDRLYLDRQYQGVLPPV